MNNPFRKNFRVKINKPPNKRNSIIFASVFALIGVIALVSSFAATNADTKVVEAEESSLSGSVRTLSDSLASEGTYIEFNDTAPACTFTNPNEPTDDPNPKFNGTYGRGDVTAQTVPESYPTPLSTGICGVGLTADDLSAYTGPNPITTDNTLIENKDIGNITIRANNVTIRRSRITSGSNYAIQQLSGYSGLTIEDSRIRSIGNSSSGNIAIYTLGTNINIKRINLSGGRVGIYSSSDTTIEDSYIVGGTYRTPGSHNEATYVRNGSNYVYRNNTLITMWRNSTAVLTILAKAGAGGGPIDNVLIEGNYLSGGGYTITADATDYPLTNLSVIDNRFELDSWRFGPGLGFGPTNSSGNIYVPS